MKKILSTALCLLMIIGVFAGCGVTDTNKSDKISIVTTIFPEYDWVMQILGGMSENADVKMLLDNGVDLHSYQPTADDIVKISTCDMFIYVGGESDEWVEDALKGATNGDMVVINLLETLGDKAKEEELVEGMQGEEEEGEEEESPEYDEHVWLSLQNAAELCSFISSKLCEIDADNKDAYKANTDAYVAKLNALDKQYEDAVGSAGTKTLLFGDRFPFRYLADDYGLDYYAAFVGCSAETEASFETIVFLANKVDELGLKAILQIESADGKIAKTIKDTTKAKDQTILTLDSMQSTTSADVKNGASYLAIMEKNLAVLKDALK
ncbi:MAG: metal ABC transporter substrate-binding protein [Clostridiales bacterium]|nr:metal ABC transporter substrate-binding protein [Clostridiales bacterium]